MHHFHYINDELYCENVPISKICRELGTPIFVYSRHTLERHFKIFQEPFKAADHLICYSMKACSNLAILRIFGNLGAGVDIVSGGELVPGSEGRDRPGSGRLFRGREESL